MPDDLTLDHAADIWDEFTQRFIAANPTIRFAEAQSPDERHAIYRARYEEVITNGWAVPADLPEGIERDSFDEQAYHMVGWEGDRMVITARLVFPSGDRPLPTEAFFDVQITPVQQVVDTGRVILLEPAHSDAQHRLFMGIMGYAWQVVRGRGYGHVCATMSASMLRLYRMMDIHLQKLGDPRPYWGRPRYPCKYDLVKTVQAFLDRAE